MRRSVIVGLLLALMVLVVWGAAPVMAATGSQNNERLENILRREQNLFKGQEQRLELANRVMTKTQEWIQRLQGEGKDTAELERALEQYRNEVQTAEQNLEQARAALGEQAGFDAKGKASDRGQAMRTIVAAGKAQRQLHLNITAAATQFRAAVMAYRQSGE